MSWPNRGRVAERGSGRPDPGVAATPTAGDRRARARGGQACPRAPRRRDRGRLDDRRPGRPDGAHRHEPGLGRGPAHVLQPGGLRRDLPGRPQGLLARHPRLHGRRGGRARARPRRRDRADGQGAGAVPRPDPRRGLHGRLSRRPDDPPDLPHRLRDPGPGPGGPARPSRSSSAGSRSRSPTAPTSPRSTAPACARSIPASARQRSRSA